MAPCRLRSMATSRAAACDAGVWPGGSSPTRVDLEITVAYHDYYKKPDHTTEAEGIRIATWDHETIGSLAREFDSVLISYCMGEHAVRLVRRPAPRSTAHPGLLRPDLHRGLRARQRRPRSASRPSTSARSDSGRSRSRRGDFFLCAHRAQERYYQGVLSAMGRINPLTYGRPMILEVPYGIYREEPTAGDRPISRLVGDAPVKKILWFGGIYPWFDARGLVDAVARVNRRLPVKLIIVGARNPFNFHPDLLAKHQELAEYVGSPGISRPRHHAGLGRFPPPGGLVPRRRPRGDGQPARRGERASRGGPGWSTSPGRACPSRPTAATPWARS